MTNNFILYLCQPPLPTQRRVPHKPLGVATNCFTTPLFLLLYHTINYGKRIRLYPSVVDSMVH